MAPTIAAIHVLQSKNSSIGSPSPTACAMKPAQQHDDSAPDGYPQGIAELAEGSASPPARSP
jgi:hypothetical protein